MKNAILEMFQKANNSAQKAIYEDKTVVKLLSANEVDHWYRVLKEDALREEHTPEELSKLQKKAWHTLGILMKHMYLEKEFEII